ncbi:MAG TPA: tetratricopeptide repeat protein [Methylotenera sp.]|nr:tetratricopeptide repeat protein [Methylotenera sp.]HPH06453.1 tetratricopeptide repeat protein [Methylotenera sp.]HPN00400.1 tetratricopeptide repeat protein [Methylotenera sp.]
MNISTWANDWFSKKTFWQLNAAFGLAFISLYIFNQNAPHYYVYHLQIALNNLSRTIGFDSTVEGIVLLLILASVLLFLGLRYGNLGQKLKFNLFTIYALLATNVSILSYLSYNEISWSLNIYEQLSAFGFGGLLNVISITCITVAAISFMGTLLWHYVLKPNPKLKTWAQTLLQAKPPINAQTQSHKLGKWLAIAFIIGSVLIALSLYKKEIVHYMRMEKELYSNAQTTDVETPKFNIANWRKAIELTKSALDAEKNKAWTLAVNEWTKLNTNYPYDAGVLARRAESYKQLGQYENARQDLKQAISLGSNDANTLTSYCWTTMLAQHFTSAIDVCERAQKNDPWDYSASLNLGHAYLFNNDLNQANIWYDKAIKQLLNKEDLTAVNNDFTLFKKHKLSATQIDQIQAKLNTKAHAWLSTLAPVNALLKQAEDAENAGDYNKAVSLYQQHIKALQKRIGDQDSQIVPDLMQLTLLQTSIGQYQPAEESFKRMQTLVAQDLGDRHIKMSGVLNDYGFMLVSAERYDEAINTYQKSIQITKLNFGEKHQYMATALSGLGVAYRNVGQLDKAISPARTAVEISLNQLLPDYQALAKRMNNLGLIYDEAGLNQSAEYHLMQALEMTELSVGPNHIDVCQRLHNLGNIMVKTKRYDEAEGMFRRALKIADNTNTPNSIIKTNAILDLAGLLKLIGKTDEATLLYARIKIIEQSS